jgi:hypothetical protein
MKERILVTGGTGYIGSHTVVELQASGYEVIIVDNLSNSQANVVDNIEKVSGICPAFEHLDCLDYAGLDGNAYSLKSSTEECRHDGISFYETLTGNDEKQEKHEFLYWEFHETDMMALRLGNWKLVVKGGTPHLYDLSIDIHEDKDVAGQYPEVVSKMVDIIHREHTESAMFRVTLPASAR